VKHFSLLVKPVSADCNIGCDYCFYLDRPGDQSTARRRQMSPRVLEQMISSYMRTEQPVYSFGWQGGEPALAGKGFFKRVTELQERYAPRGASISNGFQTNGTLINDELAAHLAEYRFLVGISVDGPARMHDRYRRTVSGRGSHDQVIRGLERLRKHGVEVNVLALVSQANVHAPREVFRYLRDELGFAYHQYVPCVEFDHAGQLAPFAISGEEWGDFLCGIFDEWRAAGDVSVREFDSLLELMTTGRANACTKGTDCRQYFVIEHDGGVYPCDFFVGEATRLGSIMEDSWPTLIRSRLFARFGRSKRAWNEECARCPYLRYCAGDCMKHRGGFGEQARNLSVLCAGWKGFYAHALEPLGRVAERISQGNSYAGAVRKV